MKGLSCDFASEHSFAGARSGILVDDRCWPTPASVAATAPAAAAPAHTSRPLHQYGAEGCTGRAIDDPARRAHRRAGTNGRRPGRPLPRPRASAGSAALLMGGLIGAGLFGLLSGSGLFGGLLGLRLFPRPVHSDRADRRRRVAGRQYSSAVGTNRPWRACLKRIQPYFTARSAEPLPASVDNAWRLAGGAGPSAHHRA